MNLELRTMAIDIRNKKNIISALSNFYTDEDFCGNNGEEFTREIAIKNGFNSTQDYIIDELKKSKKQGIELIDEFLQEWLGNDGYYQTYDYTTTKINEITVISIAFISQA